MCLCATPSTQEVGWVYRRGSMTTTGRLVCFELMTCVLEVRVYFYLC